LHQEVNATLAHVGQRSKDPSFAVFKTQLAKARLTFYEVGNRPASGSRLSEMTLGGFF